MPFHDLTAAGLMALCPQLTNGLGLFFFALYFIFIGYNLAHEFGLISF